MAWYSYFLLNVPEVFSMLSLAFALLGIPIKENIRSTIWFSFLQGGVVFILNIYMTNSLKPVFLFIIFVILIAILFKMKIMHSFIITLFSYISVVLFELIIITAIVMIFSLDIELLLEDSRKRILISSFSVTLPMLLLAMLLKKLKIKIKLPLIPK